MGLIEELKKSQIGNTYSQPQQVAQQDVATLPPIAPLNQNMQQPSTPTYSMPSMAPKTVSSSTVTAPSRTPELLNAQKQYQKDLEATQKSQSAVEKARLQTEQAKAQVEANTATAQSAQSAQLAVDETNRLALQTSDFDKKISDIDNNIKELGQFKYQDYFEDKNTGSKILAAFSIGLGAIGSAITKGPNTALEIINKAIDDDSRRQVNQFNANKEIVGTMQNALNTARQYGLDKQDQVTYLNSLKMNNTLDQLKEKLATIKINNPQLAAETTAKIDAFKAENSQKLVDLTAKMAGTKAETTQTVTPSQADVAGPSSDLRKEVTNRAEIKEYQTRSGGYQTVMSARPDRVGDLSLIYGYVKTLDPGSMVKEQEVSMQTAGRSPSEAVTGLWNKVQGGGSLTPAERKAMKEQSTIGINNFYKDTVQPAISYYEKIAKSSGIDPRMITDLVPQGHLAAQQPEGQPALSAQDQQALQWAQANPNDPRAQKILQLNQGAQNASK